MSSAEAVARALARMIERDYPAAWTELGAAPSDDRAIGAGLLEVLRALPPEIAERLEVGALSYDLGVWLKLRACFSESFAALEWARASVTEDERLLLWNLAIAATGAREGRVASEAWRTLGLEVTRGADSLPRVEGLADVKIRLASGHELRVRPRSPIHGVVVSVPPPGLAASYADVVLWDAAPIEGEDVFPMLARLDLGGAHTLPFTSAGAIEPFAADWPDTLWISSSGADAGLLIVEPEMSVEEARAEVERSARAHPGVTFEVRWP